jgi:hypothetical protein
VILCTSASATDDVLAGFDAGADDYVSKPYNPQEFVARVRAAGRRLVDLRALQPLTGLPGNTVIDREVARRVAHGHTVRAPAGRPQQLQGLQRPVRVRARRRGPAQLRAAAGQGGGRARRCAATFVGHVGGDDFVAVTDIDSWQVLADQVCEWFDALAPTLYDDERPGWPAPSSCRTEPARRPLPVGRRVDRRRHLRTGEDIHPEELVTAATEMKSYAKSLVADGGSNACVDRRQPGVDDDGGAGAASGTREPPLRPYRRPYPALQTWG